MPSKNFRIKLSSLSLREKIGQMIIVRAAPADKDYKELAPGGFLVGKFPHYTKENYIELIKRYNGWNKIKPFFAVDLEGYWNPFSYFYLSKNFGEVKSGAEAYALGKEHGKLMNEIGLNFNFSPVVEVRNKVWPGRSFKGSKKEVHEKIKKYIKGLAEEEILSTAKHYPGGNMIRDPHLFKFRAEIFNEDLDYFDTAIKNKVDAVMVGHPAVYGAIDSNGKPSSVSEEVIGGLRKKFKGLIVVDAISMWGLRWNYLFRFKHAYVDLVKAGNDIIIDTPIWFIRRSSSPFKVGRRIDYLVKAVENGKISEARINESVKRILRAKGYRVD